MLEPIISSLEKLFLEFKISRLLFWLVIVVVLISASIIYESYTNNFKLGRLEKATQLLIQLQKVKENTNFNNDADVGKIYKEIISQLSETISRMPIREGTNQRIIMLYKFFAGGGLWFLLGVLFIPNIIKKALGAWNSLYIVIIFGIAFGCLGMFIPTISWLNFVVYPIITFFIPLILILNWSLKLKKVKEGKS